MSFHCEAELSVQHPTSCFLTIWSSGAQAKCHTYLASQPPQECDVHSISGSEPTLTCRTSISSPPIVFSFPGFPHKRNEDRPLKRKGKTSHLSQGVERLIGPVDTGISRRHKGCACITMKMPFTHRRPGRIPREEIIDHRV